jgi:hypothetical protein
MSVSPRREPQLERLRTKQRAYDHLVETGQQQEHLPQTTSPVVLDRGDDEPTDQRHRYEGLDVHEPELYASPTALAGWLGEAADDG